jgi:2,3-bisphosphoglycerate-independent phosphoglycerate mutase
LKRPSGLGLSSICVTGDDTILGVAKVTGMDVCKTLEMTAIQDTDLNKIFE